MPLLWLSRAELDRRELELKNSVRECQVLMEEWYEKYRRLYARLSKRVSDAARDETGEGQGVDGDRSGAGAPSGGAPHSAVSLAPLKRSMRQF